MLRTIRLSICALMLAALVAPVALQAALPKSDRSAAKAMMSGTLYVRLDVPCATGRHPFGTYKRPLVQVSPEGSDSEAEEGMTASWWHADSTYWGIRINDPVKVEDIEWEEDEGIEIELEGVGRAEDEGTVLLLVGVNSLADFEQAFENAFSKVPLQNEHDDWSSEVKDAIANRNLVDGMTKRQAFYVTGKPKSFEKTTEGGKEVEIWHLRQSRGMKTGFFVAQAGKETGLPSSIRFEDGVLVGGGGTTASDDFDIDG